MKRKCLLAVISCFSFVCFAQQNKDSITAMRLDAEYVRSYWSDAKDVVCAPIYLNTSRIVAYSGVAAGTITLFAFDRQIKNYAQEHRNATTDNMAKYVFEPYGSGLYSFGALACFYLQGEIWHNDRSMRVALNGVKAAIISGVILQGVKFTFRRERPYQSPDDAHQWFKGFNNVSFASGHTCAAFAVSTIIAMEYRHTIWVPIVAYSLAGCTGLSRINDNKHWASDVFMGAAIGYGVAALIHNNSNRKLRTTPIIGAGSVGMVLSW